MELFDAQQVDFERVKEQYLADHGGTEKNKWEIRNLERANTKFRNWIYAHIPYSEIGKIVMPHYRYGGATVIPKEGMILSDAYRTFKENENRLEIENSQFCERVRHQKKRIPEEGVKSIFLSQEPLLIGDSYSGLVKFKKKITHLDGVHRLMALMDIGKKPEFIQSYIAIYSNFPFPSQTPSTR